MLASLYAQVEFLKTELEEKNLLIRTLIIKDNEVLCNDYNSSNSDSSSEVAEINENDYETINQDLTPNNIHDEEQNDQLNALNDQLNALNDQLNALNDQLNALNDQLNALNDITVYDESEFFLDLYLQFIKDTEEERSREINIVHQLSAVRTAKHYEFEHYYHTPEITHSNITIIHQK